MGGHMASDYEPADQSRSPFEEDKTRPLLTNPSCRGCSVMRGKSMTSQNEQLSFLADQR